MRGNGTQADRPLDGGAVAWHAAIGDYRIMCTVKSRPGSAPILSVVENGRHLAQQELVEGASGDDVEAAVVSLRQQYEPRISHVARRAWRHGRNACLTTSWYPREPSPDDSSAA